MFLKLSTNADQLMIFKYDKSNAYPKIEKMLATA